MMLIYSSCTKPNSSPTHLNSEAFSTLHDGKKIELYTLKNDTGSVVQITNYGARLVSIWMQDASGNFADVCIGLKSAEEYLNAASQSYGAVMGPYAGRIANGSFTLNGDTISLSDGQHVLHGGIAGFNTKVWSIIEKSDQKIVLEYIAEDGSGGFPGKMKVNVQYLLGENDALIIDYSAWCDRNTVVNLTNHTFFNLSGEGDGSIEDHLLSINAEKFLEIDKESIPTGKLTNVEETPLDFSEERRIGDQINADFDQIEFGNGYDHTWVLNGLEGRMRQAASLYDPKSKRVLEVFTTEPGLQFYTANFLAGKDIGKHGKPLNRRESLCLETQHFPDSPNHPEFPTTFLKAGEEFKSTTIYKFSVKQ